MATPTFCVLTRLDDTLTLGPRECRHVIVRQPQQVVVEERENGERFWGTLTDRASAQLIIQWVPYSYAAIEALETMYSWTGQLTAWFDPSTEAVFGSLENPAEWPLKLQVGRILRGWEHTTTIAGQLITATCGETWVGGSEALDGDMDDISSAEAVRIVLTTDSGATTTIKFDHHEASFPVDGRRHQETDPSPDQLGLDVRLWTRSGNRYTDFDLMLHLARAATADKLATLQAWRKPFQVYPLIGSGDTSTNYWMVALPEIERHYVAGYRDPTVPAVLQCRGIRPEGQPIYVQTWTIDTGAEWDAEDEYDVESEDVTVVDGEDGEDDTEGYLDVGMTIADDFTAWGVMTQAQWTTAGGTGAPQAVWVGKAGDDILGAFWATNHTDLHVFSWDATTETWTHLLNPGTSQGNTRAGCVTDGDGYLFASIQLTNTFKYLVASSATIDAGDVYTIASTYGNCWCLGPDGAVYLGATTYAATQIRTPVIYRIAQDGTPTAVWTGDTYDGGAYDQAGVRAIVSDGTSLYASVIQNNPAGDEAFIMKCAAGDGASWALAYTLTDEANDYTALQCGAASGTTLVFAGQRKLVGQTDCVYSEDGVNWYEAEVGLANQDALGILPPRGTRTTWAVLQKGGIGGFTQGRVYAINALLSSAALVYQDGADYEWNVWPTSGCGYVPGVGDVLYPGIYPASSPVDACFWVYAGTGGDGYYLVTHDWGSHAGAYYITRSQTITGGTVEWRTRSADQITDLTDDIIPWRVIEFTADQSRIWMTGQYQQVYILCDECWPGSLIDAFSVSARIAP